jgi:hypothetical protein
MNQPTVPKLVVSSLIADRLNGVAPRVGELSKITMTPYLATVKSNYARFGSSENPSAETLRLRSAR